MLEVLDVLFSVISEDCRFQMSSRSLQQLPNYLQFVCLDVARQLVRINSRNPYILSQICMAVLPAFSTFRREMWQRLLGFFEELLRLILDILESERWTQKSVTATNDRFVRGAL
jgi:hypothetical protein